MARIRSVHPGLFSDEAFVTCSLSARLLVIGLWTEADDKGVFEWKPVRLKMRLFPADSIDVTPLLGELANAGIVHQFEDGGRQYGAIRNFRKFQKPKTPNDIHPLPENLISYVGLPVPISEIKARKPAPFPRKGEKPIQMEDGGDKMEEEENIKERIQKEKPRIGRSYESDYIDQDGVVWNEPEHVK